MNAEVEGVQGNRHPRPVTEGRIKPNLGHLLAPSILVLRAMTAGHERRPRRERPGVEQQAALPDGAGSTESS